MSERELRRAEVLARVAEGGWTLVEAAERMEVSYRQGKRLWKRYRVEGLRGLVHRSAGRVSNRAKPKKLRRRVLQLIRAKYSGEPGKRFGPTLATEHLAEEDGIGLGVETLRRWMLEEGLWSRERRRRAHRRRRERKAHFGEMVQLDGSFHDWLEGRGPRACLMNLVDDATGATLCRMGEEETIWAAAGVLQAWIERYGVPQVLYTDWKNIYVPGPREEARLQGEVAETQFGRMCRRLGIRIIAAHSPQAKGRVERNHGTHQDRLVKKMRRQGVGTLEEANRYLEEYCPQHNARYAVAARADADYHLPRPGARQLREIFRLEIERVLSHDWVVRHANRFYQVERQSQHHAPARSKVTVCEWEDGTREIHYRGQKLKCQEIEGRPLPRELESSRSRQIVRATSGAMAGTKWKPAADHPWRRYPQRGFQKSLHARPLVPGSPSLASASAPP